MLEKQTTTDSQSENPAECADVPRSLNSNEHNIRSQDIARGALHVIHSLEQAGFKAYIVGGGVRDLLLGGHPKDFDVATNATPEQIKQLFERRARIIGRRFRIVHVRSGRDIIEVTTFRAHHLDSDNSHHALRSDRGMLLRDNVYGDLQSDALRRDFTMNALYYSPKDQSITDYLGGIDAIEKRQVQIIGDPNLRYREDPVRMLRAVRLAAKLNFRIEPTTVKPILELGYLLDEVAPARLFDESLKLFMTGHAAATFEHLREFQLFGHLFPATADSLQFAPPEQKAIYERLLRQAMVNTDERIRSNKRVTPAFILAVILWPAVEHQQNRMLEQGFKPAPALNAAAQSVIQRQVQRVAIPRRFTLTMREIWELQLRLPRRRGNQVWRVLEHPRLRAAYDFLLLREQAGEDHGGLGQWWTEFQEAGADTRQQMLKQVHPEQSRKRRPRTRRKGKKPSSQPKSSQPKSSQPE